MKPDLHPCRAFTLLELLVSMTILMLLTLLISQIVGMSGASTSSNTRKLQLLQESRFVLDRMGLDLAARLRRPELPLLFTKAVGNDEALFVSQIEGFDGDRSVSLIRYHLEETSGARYFQLERAAESFYWDAGSNPSEPQATLRFDAATPLPTPSVVNHEVFSPNVIRIEWSYRRKNGELRATAAADWSDVESLIVTVALLDDIGRQMLSEAQVEAVSNLLPDAVDGATPLAAWRAALDTAISTGPLPQSALQSVRLYQRAFHVR